VFTNRRDPEVKKLCLKAGADCFGQVNRVSTVEGGHEGIDRKVRQPAHGFLIISLAILSPVAPLTAAAGTADEELLFAEIPTVYAASRHEQSTTEAPAAVTIITHDDIVKYGYRTIGEALASVAGVFVTANGYTVNIGVRGLGMPGPVDVRVLFLLNGLPIVDKYWTAFPSELTPDMLDAIDHIEVIKGPGSALYGSNALEAIINIVTRRGRDVNGAVVSGEVGSNPSGRGVFTYGKLFSSGLDLFLSGHYEADSGPHALDFGNFGTAINAAQQRLGSLYFSAKYEDWYLQAWYSERDRHVPTGLFSSAVGDDRDRIYDEWYLAELRWEHSFDDTKSLMTRAYYQSYGNTAWLIFNATPPPELVFEKSLDRWVGYEMQFNWEPIERDRVTLGSLVEYHWMSLDGSITDMSGSPLAVVPGGSDRFLYWAAYAQNEFHFTSALSLTLGGRVDHFHSFDGFDRTAFSPRAALVWGVTKQTTAKLLFGQAFRMPSEDERDFPSQFGLGPANPDIASEQIRTYEFVLEQDFHHGLSGRVVAFHNDFHDRIDTVSLRPLMTGNMGDIRTTGFEAKLSKKFDNGVRAFANGMWQTSDFTEGPALNSPKWIGNLGVVWPILGDKLSVSLRQNYVSDRPTRVTGQRTEDEYPTDLTISSENWVKNWSFNLSVKNLFDRRYNVPSALSGMTDTVPQGARVALLRATYKF
jgi:outer membrane receptor for ferrienterochelin and colicins